MGGGCRHDDGVVGTDDGESICADCGEDMPGPSIRLVIVNGPHGIQAIRQWDNIGNLPAGEYFLYTAADDRYTITDAGRAALGGGA